MQLARKARDAGTSACVNTIQQIDNRIRAYRQQVDQLLTTYSGRHPDVLAARARLASAESERATEVAPAGFGRSHLPGG